MAAYWPFIVIGIFSGSIYGLAAMGVVLTYKTTGVFNFAYGAVAMFSGFTYWQLHDSWHLHAWVAMPILLLVIAPLLGLVFEAVFRNFSGVSAEVPIVVSLAMLAGLQVAANLIWKGIDRRLEPLFPINTFLLGSRLHVGWDQLGTLLVSLAVATLLWLLLRHTRFGTATRAVVDNGDLAEIIGLNGDNVRRAAWMLSSAFGALVGILLSPTQGLDVNNLILLVVYAFAPAVLGFVYGLPWAYGAAVFLSIVQSILSKWSNSGTISDLEAAIPLLALFVILVALGGRLKEAGLAVRPMAATAAPGAPPPPAGQRVGARRGFDRPLALGLVGLVLAFVAPSFVRGPNLGYLTLGAIIVIVALTLVVLTGWAGQISLAQFSFVGVGAFVVGHLAGHGGQHFLTAALVGMAIAVPLGVLLGLPSLRLSGLYLALATFAFAFIMDTLVFNRSDVSGGLTGIEDPRPKIFGLSFTGRISLYELVVVVLGVVGFAAFFIRRGPIGRRLFILRDSPLAASTLGVNLTVTKLVTFAVCGAVAAMAGALYGAYVQAITPQDFMWSVSLELLLLVVLGGRSVITGAVLAGAVWVIPTLPFIPAEVGRYIPLAVALGVIGLATNPEGTVALSAGEARRVLTVLRPRPRRLLVDAAPRTGPRVEVSSGR